MIEILVAKVFSTRNLVHLAHWKTKSYAQHVALGDLYGSLIGDIDAIVECYQGAFGLVNVPELPAAILPKDIISVLDENVAWIAKNQDKICKGSSAISNLVDNLSSTYLTAIYKLKNLS